MMGLGENYSHHYEAVPRWSIPGMPYPHCKACFTRRRQAAPLRSRQLPLTWSLNDMRQQWQLSSKMLTLTQQAGEMEEEQPTGR